MRILVLEDHDDVAELVTRSLEKDGHAVMLAQTLAEADARLLGGGIDLIVLDLGLPDGSGLTWCAAVRSRGYALPILLLTAQTTVATRVSGLDAGADDYLAKPFAVAELRARVRALGRRAPISQPPVFEVGDVKLDVAAKRAHVAGKEVPLTSREWGIIILLGARRGRVVTRSAIIDEVWRGNTVGAEASLEVIIGRIRKKLGASFIRTVRGEGYAFD